LTKGVQGVMKTQSAKKAKRKKKKNRGKGKEREQSCLLLFLFGAFVFNHMQKTLV
jgi:hypothetical protein